MNHDLEPEQLPMSKHEEHCAALTDRFYNTCLAIADDLGRLGCPEGIVGPFATAAHSLYVLICEPDEDTSHADYTEGMQLSIKVVHEIRFMLDFYIKNDAQSAPDLANLMTQAISQVNELEEALRLALSKRD